MTECTCPQCCYARKHPQLGQAPHAESPICPRSTIGGHACTNYQPQNRCADCPLAAARTSGAST